MTVELWIWITAFASGFLGAGIGFWYGFKFGRKYGEADGVKWASERLRDATQQMSKWS